MRIRASKILTKLIEKIDSLENCIIPMQAVDFIVIKSELNYQSDTINIVPKFEEGYDLITGKRKKFYLSPHLKQDLLYAYNNRNKIRYALNDILKNDKNLNYYPRSCGCIQRPLPETITISGHSLYGCYMVSSSIDELVELKRKGLSNATIPIFYGILDTNETL